ncbi:hypothetical protein PVAG01_02486 [Phlyctema vagabunda]|uniref:Xylanolytic transcriptional activator regulatory domain-containing protein n=1 Tax=Phlyctema vagabunda TaxID=108571 RepID=A0ABR4PQP9_9HELO
MPVVTTKSDVFQIPPLQQKRKQRKRTDTRVAELEREVQAMRTLFDQKKTEASSPPNAGSRDPTSMAALAPQYEIDSKVGVRAGAGQFEHSTSGGTGVPWSVDGWNNAAPITPSLAHPSTPTPSMGHAVDVVDRGIVTMEQAAELFEIYKKDITPHFPAVVFSHDEDINELRKSKPTLFLAVLAAASGKIDPSLYSILHSEVVMAYAHRTLVLSEKNLELVEAMVVTVLWYYPPGKFSQLKFYEYIHMAATMAIDIGIGSSTRPQRGSRGSTAENTPSPGQSPTDEELLDLVKRRTFLACYAMATTVSMNLRRPALLRYNKRVEDCIDVLTHSPNASPEDKCMARWGRLVSIGEEVSSSFSFDDIGAIVSFSDARVQLMLKEFRKRLQAWYNEVPASETDVSLMLAYYHVSCFSNELAMHDDHPPEDFRPPYRMNVIVPSDVQISSISQYVDALAGCVSSAHASLDLFKRTDVEVLRAFPTSSYARIMYSAIILVKLHASARHPSSAIGKAVDLANLRADFYLDTMIDHMIRAVGTVEFRSAYTFLGALLRLRKWHREQQLRPNIMEGEEPHSRTLFGPDDNLGPPPTTESTPTDPDTGIDVIQFENDLKDKEQPSVRSMIEEEKSQPHQTSNFQQLDPAYVDEEIMAIFNDMGNSYGGDITSWDPNMIMPPSLDDLQVTNMYNWGF